MFEVGGKIRPTTLFNLQRNNVALQVEEKCCSYYFTLTTFSPSSMSFAKRWFAESLRSGKSPVPTPIWNGEGGVVASARGISRDGSLSNPEKQQREGLM